MITPSFSLTATERVLPKLALDFLTGVLDSRVTFTRASSATYYNNLGVLVSAAVDVPRFDHNPATGQRLGLLIEEQRTNLVIRSEELETASWTKGAAGVGVIPVVTANQAIAPDGAQTADQVAFDCGDISSVTNRSLISQAVTVVNAASYTLSFWIKAADAGSVGKTLRCILENAGTAVTTTIPADWTRVSFTRTTTSTSSNVLFETRGTITSSPTANVLLWGIQLEAGAFGTSYIPTVASQVTRNADVATMTGTNFSDWFNATEGTFTFQGVNYDISTTKVILDATDGTLDERIQLSTAVNKYFMADGGSTQANFGTGTITANVAYKMAAAYKLNDLAFALNGAAAQTDNTATLPTLNQMTIGTRAVFVNTNQYSGWLQKLNYYPQRLTNAEVQAFSK